MNKDYDNQANYDSAYRVFCVCVSHFGHFLQKQLKIMNEDIMVVFEGRHMNE